MALRLILAVLLKAFLFFGCYRLTKRFFKTVKECCIVSYLCTLVVQNALLLLLSPFRLVTAWGVGIGYFVIGVLLLAVDFLCTKRLGAVPRLPRVKRLNATETVIVVLFCLLMVGLIIRPFFYFDTTDDALIQGMPKLAFIQQHGSLFVHYDSLTVNTFSNEWLGELNGLYYMLLAGEDFAAGFGNVEVLLFIAVAALYCTESYGYHGKHRYAIAFSVWTMPVITGLAMTIKTDLLSVILLPLTVAFLVQYYKSESPRLLFASILAVGATAASKISVLPGAGLLLVALVIFYFAKAKKRHAWPVVLGALFSLILCNRYVLNLIQYGNPFQRALNEKMSLSFSNFKNSLVGCVGEFLESKELLQTIGPWSSSNWVLTKGLGYLGLLCLVLFAVALVVWIVRVRRSLLDRKSLVWIAVPVFLGFLFFCASSVWYDWSFRYVAPYILVPFFAVFALLGTYEEKKSGRVGRVLEVALVCCLLLAGTANGISAFRYGQAYPYLYENADGMSDTHKKLAYASSVRYEDLAEQEQVISVLENGGKCLIFDTFSYPYYHFFGNNHCVEVDLAYDEDDLIAKAFEKDYDLYVIATTAEDAENYEEAKSFFASHGFSFCTTSSGVIFMK